MSAKHAPGPWRWTGWNYSGEAFWDRDGLEGWLIGPDGEPVAWATTTEGEDPRIAVKDEPTARLIAAAPELLALAHRVSNICSCTRTEVTECAREEPCLGISALALIAKAAGVPGAKGGSA